MNLVSPHRVGGYLYLKAKITNLSLIRGLIGLPLFLRMTHGKFLQVFHETDKIDKERLNQYSLRGLYYLYYRSEDREKYIETFLRSTLSIADIKDIEFEKSRLVKEAAIRSVEQVFETQEIDSQNLSWLTLSVNHLTRILTEKNSALLEFLDFELDEGYLSQQAVLTAVFSLAISRSMGVDQPKSFQVIGLGALLHDIGMSRLNFSPHLIERQLYPDEWEEVQGHPKEGAEIASQNPFLHKEVIQIIEQHHERFDGEGYPLKLKGTEIGLATRVVSIADSFAALILPRGGRSRMKWGEAFDVLFQDVGKFDPKILKHFEKKFKKLNS